MLGEESGKSGLLLNQPLCIGDLLQTGTKFEINTDLNDDLPDELVDDYFGAGSDDEDDDEREVTISPWDRSFDELRAQMIKIDDNIYKRIIRKGNQKMGPIPERARVTIEYDGYWEGEMYPFDSSHLRGKPHVFHTGQNEVLIGLEKAVLTMLRGEESQFIISYRLLFCEMGCPPRIKPKADGLFVIKLVKFIEYGDENAIANIPQEDRNKYSSIIDKIKDLHLSGLDYYKNGNIKRACKIFNSAVKALQFCRVADENEQEQQQKFIIKLYINLAVCYNNLNIPTKVCIMCNEIRKLTDIYKNCKALFQEGRALLKIGEYTRARKILLAAQNLEPCNKEITKELKLLAEKYEKYKVNEKTLWQKALSIQNSTETTKKENQNDEENQFRDEIKILLRSFKEDNSKGNSSNKLPLPDGLSKKEIDTIAELTKEFDLKFSLNNVANEVKYIISK